MIFSSIKLRILVLRNDHKILLAASWQYSLWLCIYEITNEKMKRTLTATSSKSAYICTYACVVHKLELLSQNFFLEKSLVTFLIQAVNRVKQVSPHKQSEFILREIPTI